MTVAAHGASHSGAAATNVTGFGQAMRRFVGGTAAIVAQPQLWRRAIRSTGAAVARLVSSTQLKQVSGLLA